MSEKIIHPEHHKNHEAGKDHKEHAERVKNHHERAAEHAKKELSEVNLAKLREEAKTHAEVAAKTTEKHQDKEPEATLGTPHTLKAHAYEQSLKRLQKKLSKPDRALSKVVHNKTVEAISGVGASTVARPSGVLGGSICAFVGSVLLLYMARHYGFRYNYLLLFILFVGGFMLGSLIELVVWATYSRKRHY